MKQKRKLALFTFSVFCLCPSITAKNTDQNENQEKSAPQWEDKLAQNIALIGSAVKDIKLIAKGADKASTEWLKQVDKTTETADKMTKKLSDAAHKMADGIDTLRHESREWQKESKEMRKELAMLRKELDKQVGKLMIRGTGGILLAIAALGAVLKTQFSNEKWNYPLLGSIGVITALGGTLLFLL